MFNIKPIKDWVYVRKCLATDMEIVDGQQEYSVGGVAVPADYGERTCFAEVIDVGPNCKEIRKEHCHKFAVMCPEMGPIHRLQGEDFAVREKDLRVKALFAL